MTEAHTPHITITESAQGYLKELLERQSSPGMGVRIFVENPGTPKAECCMAYCIPGEAEADDVPHAYADFTAYIENRSVPYLEDAVVDYNKDRMGGQLTFKAPRSKVPNLGPDASLEERINHVLYAEINPGLSAHGGHVSLIETFDDEEHGLTAVLKFGGGCQGCSAVDMTLRDGVEATLRERIPEIARVTDSTDHSVRENAYYS
ncbi:MAG: Fe-S biogenesis protein NfuA [Pseudomonadales bacterium]|nr:Fe-S biogenesis protein NfuA [Pseudomonadales bacterium]